MKQASFTPKTEQGKPPAPRLLPELPPNSPSTVLALIEKLALDPRADVEKLDRMMAMYEGQKAKEAELAYNAAKARILKKLAGIKIVKNRTVLHELDKAKPQTGTHKAFKYARSRRSTNICVRCWRKRTWICPFPTNLRRAATF